MRLAPSQMHLTLNTKPGIVSLQLGRRIKSEAYLDTYPTLHYKERVFEGFLLFLGCASLCKHFQPHDGVNKGEDRNIKQHAACTSAFDELKVALLTRPVLVLPNPELPFELITDSCKFGLVGAVLLQESGLVALYCRRTTGPE